VSKPPPHPDKPVEGEEGGKKAREGEANGDALQDGKMITRKGRLIVMGYAPWETYGVSALERVHDGHPRERSSQQKPEMSLSAQTRDEAGLRRLPSRVSSRADIIPPRGGEYEHLYRIPTQAQRESEGGRVGGSRVGRRKPSASTEASRRGRNS